MENKPILSTDDLVMEIGVLHVRLMEAQRVISKLKERISQLEAVEEENRRLRERVAKLQNSDPAKWEAEARKLREENEALRASNKLLSQRNQELDQALTEARLELERLAAEVSPNGKHDQV